MKEILRINRLDALEMRDMRNFLENLIFEIKSNTELIRLFTYISILMHCHNAISIAEQKTEPSLSIALSLFLLTQWIP